MNKILDVNTLENWEPACKISGEINISKHKDYDDKNFAEKFLSEDNTLVGLVV